MTATTPPKDRRAPTTSRLPAQASRRPGLPRADREFRAVVRSGSTRVGPGDVPARQPLCCGPGARHEPVGQEDGEHQQESAEYESVVGLERGEELVHPEHDRSPDQGPGDGAHAADDDRRDQQDRQPGRRAGRSEELLAVDVHAASRPGDRGREQDGEQFGAERGDSEHFGELLTRAQQDKPVPHPAAHDRPAQQGDQEDGRRDDEIQLLARYLRAEAGYREERDSRFAADELPLLCHLRNRECSEQ